MPPRDEITLGPAPGTPPLRGRRLGSWPARGHARPEASPCPQGDNARELLRLSPHLLGRPLHGAAPAGRAQARALLCARARSSGSRWRGRLTASRMPALFLQLRRNRSYWPSKPFPADGDQLTFRGSELLYEYFTGRGLQSIRCRTSRRPTTSTAPARRAGNRASRSAARGRPGRSGHARAARSAASAGCSTS